jgi:hypothetical protein
VWKWRLEHGSELRPLPTDIRQQLRARYNQARRAGRAIRSKLS